MTNSVPTSSGSGGALAERLAAGEYADRERYLSSLAETQKGELCGEASAWLTTGTEVKTFGLVLKTFLPFFHHEELKSLSRRLLDESVGIRLAVLEALVARAPASLSGYLPRLLTAGDLRLRSLAIKGLAQIDMPEAVAHIDHLLTEGTREEKIAGLQCAFLLPFAEVKPALWRFAALEQEIELLEKFGMLVTANPDPEVPFRLYRLMEGASSEKGAVLKELIKKTCAAVEAAKILGERFPDFLEKLQTWIVKLQATRFAQDCVEQLAAGNEDELREFLPVWKKQLSKPVVREVFLEALKWPLEETVRQRLQSLLEIPESAGDQVNSSSAPAPKPIVAVATADGYEAADLDSRIRFLAALAENQVEVGQKIIAELMKAQRPEPAELSAAFRAAVRLQLRTFKDRAQRCIRHPNQVLAISALEYLAAFFPDLAFSFLGMFLNSENLRSKSVAVKILRSNDPQQALAVIENLLQSGRFDQQNLALACSVHFDFSLVRPLLWAFLEKAPDAGLIQSALSLFQANPDPESLYGLYRLEQLLPGALGANALSARRKIETALESLGMLTGERSIRDDALAKRWKEEQKKQEIPLPEYSVKALKAKHELKTTHAVAKAIDTGAQVAGGVFLLGLKVLPVAIGIAVVIGLFSLFGYLQTLFSTDASRVAIGVPVGISGTVQGIATGSGNLLVTTLTMGNFEVQPDAEGFSQFLPGSDYKAVVIPVRKNFGVFIVEKQMVQSDQ